MCSSDTASWCCARASGDPQPAAGCAAGGGVRVREGGMQLVQLLGVWAVDVVRARDSRLSLWGLVKLKGVMEALEILDFTINRDFGFVFNRE